MALIEEIKYEGPVNALVWKHPLEEFRMLPQIRVNDSQGVIVFEEGRFKMSCDASRHQGLRSEGFSVAKLLDEFVQGTVRPYRYEIYFVNYSQTMYIYWGTESPWSFVDPVHKLSFNCVSHGRTAVKVKDAQTLMQRLMGIRNLFTDHSVELYFRPIICQELQSIISREIAKQKIEAVWLKGAIGDLTDEIKRSLHVRFLEYGLELKELFIERFELVEDDYYDLILSKQNAEEKGLAM